MADEVKEPETKEEATPAEAENTVPGPIPYDRFREVNERNKTLAAQVAELEKARKKREDEAETARQAQLKEQEKYRELAEELEGKVKDLEPRAEEARQELEALRAIVGDYAKAQMEQVPDIFKPVLEKLPLTDRLEWLAANSKELKPKTQAGGIPETPAGSGKGELTEDERRRRSSRTF